MPSTNDHMTFPDPILFELGPLVIRWYGVLIVGGALLGTWLAAKEAPRRGQNPDHVWNIMMFGLLGGVLGGRLYHVVSTPAGAGQSGISYYFGTNPWTEISLLGQSIPFPRALAIWEGGLGIYGGVLGGVIVVWLYTRRHKLPFTTFLDLGAMALLLGQAIGRWGNYFNQELYGQPTTLPWGIPIDMQHRLAEYQNLPLETRFHPAFLYESLLNLGVVAILLYVHRRHTNTIRSGDIAAGYLIGYGAVRFIVEFFRPDAWRMGALPTAQWIGIALVITGVAWIVWNHRSSKERTRNTRRRARTQP
jgi:phosphatidylglycerol:prolipoprotein diacylglycerol transferase